MTKYFYAAVLFAFLSLFAKVHAADSASVYLYLFKSGKPLPQVEISADGAQSIASDKDGYARMQLDPGAHHLSFRQRGQELLELDLPLSETENIQLIITFFSYGQKPRVEIESSNAARGKQLAASEKKPEALGKGFLEGEVTSSETKKPIAGAQVFISGLANELTTDQQGKFKAEVPVGEYSISVLHSDFSTQIKDKVPVVADATTTQPFAMTPRGLELPEYVVLEPHIGGSLASIIEEQRTDSAVSNVLGAEQITRNGDSDAASALRRVTGLTLVGGKFVFIRGLGERYSTTLLNGISVPSPDPTRRVVPLDLFPTSVLESVLIQKSYSVDRQAEFAGGTVELRTRGIPDEFFAEIDYQTGFNDGTTFTKGLRYKGGDLDFLGADDGARALPGSLQNALSGGRVLRPQTPFNPDGFTREQLDGFGRDLSGVYDVNEKNINPDQRISAALGDAYEFGDFGFGFTSSLRWSDTWDTQDEILNTFAVNGVGANGAARLDPIIENNMTRTERETQTNGYLGMEGHYTEHHKLFARAIILRQTFDEARITEGFSDADATDIRRTRLRYIENKLIVGQWGGEHALNRIGNINLLDGIDWLGDIKLDWQLSRANSGREAPDEREFRFDRIGDDFFFSRRADSNSSTFSSLNDDDMSYRLDLTIPFNFHKNLTGALSSGFIDRLLTRESAIRRFSFAPSGALSRDSDILGRNSVEAILSDENIGTQGFVLNETTRATDNFTAEQKLFSYYGQGDVTLFERLRLTGGVRVEDNDQTVSTFQLFNPNNAPIESTLAQVDLLPSAAATLFITDKQQLRFSYSETLSRPDFRELSPAPFTDPNNDKETVGNPDLQQAEVTSYDVRWEYYFSGTENLTLGWFRKELTNPIETILLPGPAGLLTLQNAATAEIFGYEAEILKHLEFISPKLANFFVGGNYTWSQSEIELLPANLQTQTTNFRPLQGHSKYIINAQVGYDNPDNGITSTLLYNTIGKRITEVGSLGAPDKYEQPFDQLDFVFRYKFPEHYSVAFNARNLLDDTVTVRQGDRVTRQFKRGREFRLSFKLEF
ncbi:MAG: TonB-dependent receptor [Gammaproteobacteria bacterium HGW-Gammaproteobacteria-3]|nr:MAG: TonB-dependent receptor [Gammaproteobacteria bacterium HGW-Gammaproteobacteria-3]